MRRGLVTHIILAGALTTVLLFGWSTLLMASDPAPHPLPGSTGNRASAPFALAASDAVTVIDITFTSSWDGSLQRASIARLDPWPPSGPVPLVIYVHGWIQCGDKAPHHLWAASDLRGVPVAQRGWLFAAPELHGERPLNQDPYDIGTWCPDVSVGYRPLGARPAQRDILDLIDYMTAHYNVDPNRVYLFSDSAGALTALTTLAKFPDRFAAAVEFSGPTDLALWYQDDATTGPGTYYPNIRREVGGTPEEVPYDYARRSPVTFAENLALVPLAIVHGTQDTKVPPHHAQNLYDAIRSVSPLAPVELYWFDGGHSGPSDPYTITWALDWLNGHTRRPAPSAFRVLTDAGGTPGQPGEPELGPYRFWWAGWVPALAPERWTHVALTHTVGTYQVTGTVSDTAGVTLTLNLGQLGWSDTPVTAQIVPPAPALSYTLVLTPAHQAVSLTLPGGEIDLRVSQPRPEPTPTPTPSVGDIRGIVFEDRNGNGVRDEGEPGLAGARVELLRNGSALVTSIVTKRDGLFAFLQLPPAAYLVREQNPPGYKYDTTVNNRYVVLQAGDVITVTFGDKMGQTMWFPTVTRRK